MAGRVTIQDIADALGISRNTVSKAINNTGVLADATREKILLKAIEMGYKQFSYINLGDTQQPSATMEVPVLPRGGGVIAILTTSFLGNSHFSSTMLDRLQRELSQAGYSLMMHRISPEDLSACRLPATFVPDQTKAIICIEMFDYAYAEFLSTQELPLLFIDGPVFPNGKKLYADILLMNNRSEIHAFVAEMKRRGKTTFGYIGNAMHCLSFQERFLALREALYLQGLPDPERYSIAELATGVKISSSKSYQAYLFEELDKLSEFPEVFLCSNDFVAIDFLQVCKKKGLRVPKDFYLCGFDDSPESRIITPSFTTIHIHSQIMGYSATHILLSRIKEPSLNYRTVYTETSLIYRESTED